MSKLARFVVVCLTLAVLPLTPIAQASVNCTASPTSLADPDIARMWENINNARATAGVAPLTWSSTLAVSSAWMAGDAAARDTAQTTVDSFGRDVRPRLTDCDYRTDATGYETLVQVNITSPDGTWNIWQFYNNLQMYQVIYGSQYTVGGLGRAYNPSSSLPYFWVLDVGTLPDSGSPSPTLTPTPTVTSSPTVVPPTATLAPAEPLAALCISHTIPVNMTSGSAYNVSVTMQNMGSTTWSEAQTIRLGLDDPHDSWIYGEPRVYLGGATVPPGGQYTFAFTMSGPAPGTYPARWRMVQDGVTWFGDYCGPIQIAVTEAQPTATPFPQPTATPIPTATAVCHGSKCRN